MAAVDENPARENPARLVILNSITKLVPAHAGAIVVSGSHGGSYPAAIAAKGGLRGVVFSDAGVGLDGAGIAGLWLLDEVGLAAVAADYMSARIGDGADIMARGRISFVNEAAARLGCRKGEDVRYCCDMMQNGAPSLRPLPAVHEHRFLLRAEYPQIWAVDSASLARPEDAGAIMVCGSHGGLLGGDPATAIRPHVAVAAFNDAGIGIDNAGISRLVALEARGIAAVTVSAASAQIGDARSSWETGVISACNGPAQAEGARAQMPLKDFLLAFAQGAAVSAGS